MGCPPMGCLLGVGVGVEGCLPGESTHGVSAWGMCLPVGLPKAGVCLGVST